MKRIGILCVLSVFFFCYEWGGGGGGWVQNNPYLIRIGKKYRYRYLRTAPEQASKSQATCIRRKLASSSISLWGLQFSTYTACYLCDVVFLLWHVCLFACLCVCVYEDFIGVQRRGEGGGRIRKPNLVFQFFPISLCTLELCQARYLLYPFLFPHSLSFHYLKKPFGDETSYPLSHSKKTKKKMDLRCYAVLHGTIMALQLKNFWFSPLFAAEPVSSFAPCCLNLKEESSTGLLLQKNK